MAGENVGMCECSFELRSLGSGGISEAAQLGDSSFSIQRRRALGCGC